MPDRTLNVQKSKVMVIRSPHTPEPVITWDGQPLVVVDVFKYCEVVFLPLFQWTRGPFPFQSVTLSPQTGM